MNFYIIPTNDILKLGVRAVKSAGFFEPNRRSMTPNHSVETEKADIDEQKLHTEASITPIWRKLAKIHSILVQFPLRTIDI